MIFLSKSLLTIAVLLFCFHTHGQIVAGTVVGSDDEILIGAYVQDTVHSRATVTDRFGNFNLKVEPGSILQISFIGYQTHHYRFQSEQDTTNVMIRLEQKINELPEAVISGNSSRVERVYTKRDMNVLDYIPYGDFTLVLKAYRSRKTLSFEAADTTLQVFDLGKLDAKELFEDCYGSVHILTRDSCYQIWTDSSLHFIDVVSMEAFEKLLKPCIANFQNDLIFGTFSDHNKRYKLLLINQETKARNDFFYVYDKAAEKVASQNYWGIIGYYYANTSEEENIIANGAWDGDVLKLQISGDWELNRMINWYKNIRAREIDVFTTQSRNYLATLDVLNDTLYIFNQNGTKVKQHKIDLPRGKIDQFVTDQLSEKVYLITHRSSVYSVHEVNLTSGDFNTVLSLKEISFPENLQIYGGEVYFVKPKSGFHKLYRVRIE